MPRLTPEANPRALLPLLPTRSGQPLERLQTHSYRRRGKEVRSTYLPAPVRAHSPPRASQQPWPICLEPCSWRNQAGASKRAPQEPLLQGSQGLSQGLLVSSPHPRACTSSPPLMPMTTSQCRQQESCSSYCGGDRETPRDEAALSRQPGYLLTLNASSFCRLSLPINLATLP